MLKQLHKCCGNGPVVGMTELNVIWIPLRLLMVDEWKNAWRSLNMSTRVSDEEVSWN